MLKGADVRDLLHGVRTVATGGTYIYPTLAGRLVADFMHGVAGDQESSIFDGLTDREQEVLRLLANGMTSPQIATELQVSPHTVQSHRDHIMTKLNLHSRAALTKYAIRKGLVTLDS